MNADSSSAPRFQPKVVWALLVFTVIYRIVASQIPALSNTSPAMALCFGGGLLLGRKFWWIPAVLMLGSDLLIGFLNGGGGIGSYTVMTILLFCGAAWLGSRCAGWSGKTWPAMWCGVLLSSVVFYVAANTFAWIGAPEYSKSLAGWWQSQTVGLPQYPPSWLFLRNTLIGDSIWCALAGLVFFFQKHGVAATAAPESV